MQVTWAHKNTIADATVSESETQGGSAVPTAHPGRPVQGSADGSSLTPLGDLPPLAAEEHVCELCDFRYAEISPAQAEAEIRGYPDALDGVNETALRRRPEPGTWSMLEYACHVRDVYAVYTDRVRRALAEHNPVLEPMHNQRRAARDGYNRQLPSQVLDALEVNVGNFLKQLDAIDGTRWTRTVTRLPGETRTVLWLVRQAAHEGRHHLRDITSIRSRLEQC